MRGVAKVKEIELIHETLEDSGEGRRRKNAG
jgi:hypothetical protein